MMRCVLACVAGLMLVAAPPARAVQLVAGWNGGAGNWSDAAKWSGGVVPNNGANTYIAQINTAGSTPSLNIDVAIDNLSVSSGNTLSILEGNALTVGTGAAVSVTNNGAINLIGVGQDTSLVINGPVTLGGTGILTLGSIATPSTSNRIIGVLNGVSNVLTNGANHTIQGSGTIGDFFGVESVPLQTINQGVINANVSGLSLVIDSSGGAAVNQNIWRASNNGILAFQNGTADNQGVVDVANGGQVIFTATAIPAQFDIVNSTLSGGLWQVTSTGGFSRLSLGPGRIRVIDTSAAVQLSGNVLLTEFQQLDPTGAEPSALHTLRGELALLNGRNLESQGDPNSGGVMTIGATGILSVENSTFTAPSISNAGEIRGTGTITGAINNTGIVRSTLLSGVTTLTLSQAVSGTTGNVIVESGTTLATSAAGQSQTGTLAANGGTLNLGANIEVHDDYTNVGFGSGNGFNPTANIIGAGAVRAAGDVHTELTGDAVTNGDTAAPTLTIGHVHVGVAAVRAFQVTADGTSGPALRGAVQTTGITDPRLSASPSNFGPLDIGQSTGDINVTFTATTHGAYTLPGQQITVVDNFANTTTQTLSFVTGNAYVLADPLLTSSDPVNFGIIHVGETPTMALTFKNDAPVTAGGFTERLRGTAIGVTGDALFGATQFFGLAAQASNSSITVGVDTATAGAKNGTITVAFDSAETGGSGLGVTPLTGQDITVNVIATVNQFANPVVEHASGDGQVNTINAMQYEVDLLVAAHNDVATPFSANIRIRNNVAGQADDLGGSFSPTTGAVFTLGGFNTPFTGVAPGAAHSGLTITLPTTNTGCFEETITLMPVSENTSNDTPLANVTIELKGIVAVPGDLDLDGDVDITDLSKLATYFGTLSGATWGQGDINRDGDVDINDLSQLATYFGTSIGPYCGGGGGGLEIVGQVPEPVTCIVVTISALAFRSRRRRRAD